MFFLEKITKIVKISIPTILFATAHTSFSMEKTHKTPALSTITRIVVDKSKRQLAVYNKDTLLKTYKVALGFTPTGHKEQEGDGKTPEGTYKICAKNPNSQFHKSLKVSYPNAADIKCAKGKCVAPGDHIMIHGLGKGFSSLGSKHALSDWTLGCVALTNEEIEEIYTSVNVGTTIQINP